MRIVRNEPSPNNGHFEEKTIGVDYINGGSPALDARRPEYSRTNGGKAGVLRSSHESDAALTRRVFGELARAGASPTACAAVYSAPGSRRDCLAAIR